ncbi:CcmD family protein [Roseivirga pacifica]|nr:CcmD family protein [Roseivirga pacifica]MCO6359465.1 CcmD family protein [Roseivirga pacifica]MCO6366835.1 CcmD family protein [Roseivirga pacifica]MCO6370633.1 CcmD family protein [Roseivirga pacifica]MCO6374491.1 CcmD family protein [Roseivirga pacifica]MCO6379750.1 CcmD family protein [Roseivirga pacifica]
MKKFIVTFLLFLSLSVFAQDGQYTITEDDYNNTSIEMADTLRSNGKIYVVVGVVMIIFAGVITYMVLIDRKISKLEKEVFSEKG